MPDGRFVSLPPDDRKEALLHVQAVSGVPADLLEKDVWVVSALGTLFRQDYAGALSFKGGTSLSKVYGVIDRFSEDIDVTCDIRTFVDEATVPDGAADVEPSTRSQAQKWSKLVRAQLPGWVQSVVLPGLADGLEVDGLAASVTAEGDSIHITYESVVSVEVGYVRPVVLVEFGARSTGEPAKSGQVVCTAAAHLPGLTFPVADVRAMAAERTFWEKATAVHAFSVGGPLKTERFSRHWYDLFMLDRSGVAQRAAQLRDLAETVAKHKQHFFRVRREDGREVDYLPAVRGHLRLVPGGDRLADLAGDYGRMMDSGMLSRGAPTFEEVIAGCTSLEKGLNRGLGPILLL